MKGRPDDMAPPESPESPECPECGCENMTTADGIDWECQCWVAGGSCAGCDLCDYPGARPCGGEKHVCPGPHCCNDGPGEG